MKQAEVTHIACVFSDDVMVAGATIIDDSNSPHAIIQCFWSRLTMHKRGYGSSSIEFIEQHYFNSKDVHVIVTNDAVGFYEARSSFEWKYRRECCCGSSIQCNHYVYKGVKQMTTSSKYPNALQPSQQQLAVVTLLSSWRPINRSRGICPPKVRNPPVERFPLSS